MEARKAAFIVSPLFLAWHLAVVPALALSTLSVSDLLASPSTYNDSHVVVAGSVADVEAKTSHAGNDYETFDICDVNGGCLRVFTWGHPVIHEGGKITVRGTFETTKRVGKYTFHNEIEADEGSL
jgi:hypothetical protein